MRKLLVVLFCVLTISAAADERREVRAVRTTAPPVIDGRVDEDVWALAPAITNFQQQRPDNGQPSSEEVRVHLLFDDDALYVGAFMPQKGSPVARLLARRDTYLESEWIGILLDPQLDRRSGYELFVNPDNVQLDGVISNDTSEDYDWDGVWQSATHVFEGGWSAEMRIPFSQFRFPEKDKQVWGINFIRWVRARQEQARMIAHPRNQPGYVSKFGNLVGLDGIRPRPKVEALPYVTAGLTRDETILRPDPLGQRSRSITDAGIDLRWSTRSSLMITATIQPDFGQVEVDPAILNLSEFELFFPEKRPFFVEGSKIFNFGAVARNYTASPYRLAHPLLFYSRRIGREPQGNARLGGDFLDLPSSTSILGAAKVSGRTNGGTSFSVLDAITDSEHATVVSKNLRTRRMVAPRSNFFAGRVTQDLGSESRVGVLATSVLRQSDDATSFLPDRATTLGVDGYTWFGKHDTVFDWMFAASQVEGSTDSIAALQRSSVHSYQRTDATHVDFDPTRTSLSGWGGKATLSRERGTWRYALQAQQYSPGFDINELGFQPRADLRAYNGQLVFLDVATRKHTRNFTLAGGPWLTQNTAGDTLTKGLTVDYSALTTNYWNLYAQLSYGFDAIDDRETRGGPSIATPSGWSTQLRWSNDTRKRFWIELTRNDARDEDDGYSHLSRATLIYRPKSNVTLQLTATHVTASTASDFIANAGGKYVFARLLERRFEIAPRVDWTFTRNLSLQLYLQPLAASGTYSKFKELLAPRGAYRAVPASTVTNPDFTFRSFRGNAVLRWEVGPTTLFAIWNEGREARALATTGGRFGDFRDITEVEPTDRIMVKASYRFDYPR